jgi:hypothetical protein
MSSEGLCVLSGDRPTVVVSKGYRQQSEASSRLQRNKLEKGLLCRQGFGALTLPICLYHTRVQE